MKKKTCMFLGVIICFLVAVSVPAQAQRSQADRAADSWYAEAELAAWDNAGQPPETTRTTAPQPKVLSIATYPDYPIQPHTVLHIVLKGDEPHLADPGLQLKVSTRGTIRYPYIGEVNVMDMTIDEVAKKIEGLLEKDYVRAPEVSVTVIASPGYWMLGEIRSPGRYDMTMDREITLTEAISLAGGYAENYGISLFRNDWTSIRVTRTAGGERRLYEFKLQGIPEEFTVKPDDIIICNYGKMMDLGNYYIFGEIMNPGKYPIVGDDFSGRKLFRFSASLNRYIEILGASNVVDAVFNAQGLTFNAARNWVYLVRVENGKRKRWRIPMGHIYYKGDLSTNIRLKDGDVITVSESWF